MKLMKWGWWMVSLIIGNGLSLWGERESLCVGEWKERLWGGGGRKAFPFPACCCCCCCCSSFSQPVRMATMRALVCRKLGDPTLPFSSQDSPFIISAQNPRPRISSPLHVRVRVCASSLNFATLLLVMGKYQERPSLPFIPGSDFSGVVVEVGQGVKDFKVGDIVCGVADVGSFAEELVIREDHLFIVPPGCDIVAAGGVLVTFGTSHVGLVHRAHLHAGQVLLVLGAAGGVGLAAVQIGKFLGATVIAVARGKQKEELLISAGADHVIDPTDGNMINNIQAYLRSKQLKGVDVLYDPVGGKLFKDSLKCLNWGAQILIIGFTSGEIPNIAANIALVKNWTVHGLFWGSYFKHQPNVLRNSVKELLSWLAKGAIDVHISHKFSLSEANLAFSALAQRKVQGKVMIVLDENQVSEALEGTKSKL